jgi:1-phosphofructokinase
MARLAIAAPSPVLTVTIESGDEQGAETHFHAGGQGVWVARMAGALGAEVVLCVVLCGETGEVLSRLLRSHGVELRSVWGHGRSGSYVHDRRGGERTVVAETQGPRLERHEADELYGMMLAAGLAAGVAVLTGPRPADALAADFYRRLAADLRNNQVKVFADLTGGALQGALEGGVDLVKLSHEELIAEGYAASPARDALLAGMFQLHDQGARNLVVSRAADPALGLIEGRVYELVGPRFEASDPSGTGDSMFAAIGVALANGREMIEAMRLGVAAGALNVTRRGLGSGHRDEIELMLAHVRASELEGRSAL